MRGKCLIGHHYFAVDSLRETLDSPRATRCAVGWARGLGVEAAADSATTRLPGHGMSTKRMRACPISRAKPSARAASRRGPDRRKRRSHDGPIPELLGCGFTPTSHPFATSHGALRGASSPKNLTLVAARISRAVVPGEAREALAVLAGGLQGKTLLAQALQQ